MFRRLFLVCAALVFVACGGPQLNVVSQANPSPLKGQTQLSLSALDFSSFEVGKYKTEAEFLDTKDDKEKAAWQENKETFERAFTRALTETALSQGLHIAPGDAGTAIKVKVKVTFIDPGSPMRATEVNLTITVLAADGSTIDELHEVETLGASIGTTAGGRLKYLGEDMGKGFAKYLAERAGRN